MLATTPLLLLLLLLLLLTQLLPLLLLLMQVLLLQPQGFLEWHGYLLPRSPAAAVAAVAAAAAVAAVAAAAAATGGGRCTAGEDPIGGGAPPLAFLAFPWGPLGASESTQVG